MIVINRIKNCVDLYHPNKLTYRNIYPLIDEVSSRAVNSGLAVYAKVYQSSSKPSIPDTIRFELVYPGPEEKDMGYLDLLKTIIVSAFDKI